MNTCQTTTMDTSYNEPANRKYRKIALLGTGSYGTCYLVKQNSSTYVLKEVYMNSLTSVEKQRAFNEVSLLATLKHRHIIGYKDSAIDHTNGILSIIMDYADSGDLAMAIEKQKGVPFSEHQIFSWFIQISQALQYIHSLNILHRDLKTQNIFLCGNDTIKIGDFGICRLLSDSKDFAKTAIGTPFYLSPEIILRKPYNTKSDMWALGCVLFEISALERPFKAESFPQLVDVILAGRRQPFPVWMKSGIINKLVEDLLSSNPDQRPSTDEILANSSLRRQLSSFIQITKHEIPCRQVTRVAYSSNPVESVKRSAPITNSNNSKIPKCSLKTAENKQKPNSTRINPPAVVVTDHHDKLSESDRRKRSFSTRAVSPATFVTDSREQFEANEWRPRSSSCRTTPPGKIGDETNLNENEKKSTSSRIILPAVIVTAYSDKYEKSDRKQRSFSTRGDSPASSASEYQDKYEESDRRQRSFSTRGDSPPTSASEYQDKYEESDRRQRSFSSRGVSPPTSASEYQDKYEESDRRQRSFSTRGDSPASSAPEYRDKYVKSNHRQRTFSTRGISPATFVSEPRHAFEVKENNCSSASIQTTPLDNIKRAYQTRLQDKSVANYGFIAIGSTLPGIAVNENKIADKCEERKREKRFVFQRTTVANKSPDGFLTSEAVIGRKNNMNITYIVNEKSDSIESSKSIKLTPPISANEIDFGYSSEEADSTDKYKSAFKHLKKNREQLKEGIIPTEFKTAQDGISNHQNHCNHSQCNQCLLDMMWKNRIRGCIDLSNSNGDYLKLKKKLLLIFGHDLFQTIYESLLHEWERNESNVTQTSIQSFAKLLNYEQVQHLPLMMQLIQLDLVKLSEKET